MVATSIAISVIGRFCNTVVFIHTTLQTVEQVNQTSKMIKHSPNQLSADVKIGNRYVRCLYVVNFSHPSRS